jgi:divalent metal cation (Fe/Co/Zn/Cd) transporter
MDVTILCAFPCNVGGAVLGLPLLDPAAALIVSGMIIKAGLESGYQRYIPSSFDHHML